MFDLTYEEEYTYYQTRYAMAEHLEAPVEPCEPVATPLVTFVLEFSDEDIPF